MAFEIPEIVYAFGPQLKAFMEVGILLTYFAVSCSSLSEDSAEFRYGTYLNSALSSLIKLSSAAALQELHITPI